MTGFSLGGITAAALASDNTDYNIQQVVTAGSPIARFDIPESVGVLAYESTQDVMPALDGGTNPSRWKTVHDMAPTLATEDARKVILPDSAHDLDRYARMAAIHSDAETGPSIAKYFRGHLTITDSYVHDARKVIG
jgi:poly(3-hydroxybutyrate) depolymerase